MLSNAFLDEIYIQLPVPLSTLLKYVPQCENIVCTSTPLAKSRLLVPPKVINSMGDALYNDLATDFTRHRQKGNFNKTIYLSIYLSIYLKFQFKLKFLALHNNFLT